MTDNVDKDIYREDFKAYKKDNRALARSTKKLYSLVLGQCTESLRAKIKGEKIGIKKTIKQLRGVLEDDKVNFVQSRHRKTFT